MKKITFFFLLSVFQLYFSQQNINFETSKFADILAKAKAEKKLIFLDAYTSWCGPCKMMEKNIFSDTKVADYFNKNFINAHFDMEKGEGRDLAQKYRIMSYPTLLFLNSDGDIVGKEIGYLDKNQFLEFGSKNNNPKLVNTNLKDEYLKGNLDQPMLLNFINLYAQKDPIIAKQASEKYFTRKKDKTFSAEEINVLLTFTQSVDDANYKIFTQNKTAITALMPEKNYEQFDNYLKLSDVFRKATDDKSKTIDDAKILKDGIAFMPKDELEKSLNIYKLNYYLSDENYAAYEKTALVYYQDPDDFNNTELLAAASIFNDNITNPASLKAAARWVEKVVMSSENFDSTNLLAQLYYKTGKKEEAKMFAEMAVNFAKEENKDATKANEILDGK